MSPSPDAAAPARKCRYDLPVPTGTTEARADLCSIVNNNESTMTLQPLVEQPPSDDAKETGVRPRRSADPRRVLWRCPACVRREPADRNALRSLRCAARLFATTVRAARNSSGSFGRNGNGGAAPRGGRLAMTHAIYSASGSFRQSSRGAIRNCRLGSFGHNDILFWLSELFWLGDLLWLSEARVRLAAIACVGLRRLGFVRRNFAAVTGAPRVRSAKYSRSLCFVCPKRRAIRRNSLSTSA
jgi:hypothetical protein